MLLLLPCMALSAPGASSRTTTWLCLLTLTIAASCAVLRLLFSSVIAATTLSYQSSASHSALLSMGRYGPGLYCLLMH